MLLDKRLNFLSLLLAPETTFKKSTSVLHIAPIVAAGIEEKEMNITMFRQAVEVVEKERHHGMDAEDGKDPVDSEQDLLSSFFTSVPVEEEEAEIVEKPKVHSTDDIMMMSAETSELLRGGRIGASNREAGMTLDFEKLAQSMGMQMGMPLDTKADVPRDESVGIREDGIALANDQNENTAKVPEGTAAKDE